MKIPFLRTGGTPSPDDPSSGASGVDGTGSWFSDNLPGGPDSNPELSGRMKYDIYREMKLSDPAIRSLTWLYKLPIRSAEWVVIPAESDPAGEAVAKARADFVAWQFGLERHNSARLDLSWDEWLQQDLLYLDYGAQGGEMIWADVEEWRDADGEAHMVRPLARIAPRAASSVSDIEVDPRTGKINRIRQDVPGADWIPGGKMQWLVNEKEGANWYGSSLLRAVYGVWKIKRNLIVSGAIGFDRYAAGLPVVRHPPGEKDKAEKIGRNIRVHERAWVTLEGAPPPDGEWDVEILSGAQSLADPVNLLRYLDQQIAAAGLQHFSQLGSTNTGSRAVGETLVEPFYLAVQAVARAIAQEKMRSVIRRLWDVNFGVEVPIPSIQAERVSGQNVSMFARALADLTSAGLSFVDRDTQDDIRDLLDLRHLPDVTAAVVKGLPPNAGLELQPPPAIVAPPAEGGSVIPIR